jgi:hypothetical protein
MLKRIISGDQSGAGWGDLQGFPLNRQAKWVQSGDKVRKQGTHLRKRTPEYWL